MNKELGAHDDLAAEISLVLSAKSVLDGLHPLDTEAPNTALWVLLTMVPQEVLQAYLDARRRSNVVGWWTE